MTTVDAAIRDGMHAQLEALAERVAAGAPRLGWKVGLNEPAMQARLGLDGFVVGALDGARRCESGTVCAVLGRAMFVEAEVAVRIDGELGTRPSPAEAWSAVGALAPAIEVVDYAQPANGLAAILAHSIFHHASVIGAACAPAQFARLTPDLPTLVKNGTRGRGPEPALRIADLGAVIARVSALLGDAGERLRVGDWILTGSWVTPAPVAPGDAVEVDFGPLGRVAARFEAA